jgi:hypothetical protein
MPPEYRDDDADSSPASQTENPDVAAESSTALEGANTQSESPTTDTFEEGSADEDSGTLLDAITRAADGDENADDTDGEDSDSDDDQNEDDEDAEDQSDEAVDEGGEDTADGKDDKPEPFHKHPRWKEMVRERDSFKDRAESLEPRAQEYDKITTFMNQNELSVQEVADGLQVVAMMKNDPARAREVLAKRMEGLDQFAGYRLPEDLQTEVNEGVISEDRAQELARLRNEKDFVSERASRRERENQETRQHENARQIIEGQQAALRSWEADVQKTDPDYKRIQRFVTKELRLLVQQEPPRTNEQAVELAKKAYKTVKDELKAAMPTRPAVKPGARSQDTSTSSAQGQPPESFMQAIEQAANQS